MTWSGYFFVSKLKAISRVTINWSKSSNVCKASYILKSITSYPWRNPAYVTVKLQRLPTKAGVPRHQTPKGLHISRSFPVPRSAGAALSEPRETPGLDQSPALVNVRQPFTVFSHCILTVSLFCIIHPMSKLVNVFCRPYPKGLTDSPAYDIL